MEPTVRDIESPLFQAIWTAIKGWDIERSWGAGRAGATGTDVMAIIEAIRRECPIKVKQGPRWMPSFVWRLLIKHAFELDVPRGKSEADNG